MVPGAEAIADRDGAEGGRMDSHGGRIRPGGNRLREHLQLAGGFTQSAALRLARAAERSGAAVIVIGSRRLCGTFAALSLRLKRARTCFSRESRWAPGLFDGLAIEAQVMRNKLGGAGASASWEALADPSSMWMSGATAESTPSASASIRTSGTKPATVASSGDGEVPDLRIRIDARGGNEVCHGRVRCEDASAAGAFDSSNSNGTLNAGRRAGMR